MGFLARRKLRIRENKRARKPIVRFLIRRLRKEPRANGMSGLLQLSKHFIRDQLDQRFFLV